jgi:hypothetical protein
MAKQPTLFDISWAEIKRGSGAIVRQVGRDRVHVSTAGGLEVLYELRDLYVLEAAVALLRGLGGKR